MPVRPRLKSFRRSWHFVTQTAQIPRDSLGGAQLPEDALKDRGFRRTEPQQVGIAGRTMGDVEPQVEEQGTLEQETLGVPGCAQPVEGTV
jgi:hypothetical protein